MQELWWAKSPTGTERQPNRSVDPYGDASRVRASETHGDATLRTGCGAAHVLADSSISRKFMYVGLTRGKEASHLYVETEGAQPMRDVLATIVGHGDGCAQSLIEATALSTATVSPGCTCWSRRVPLRCATTMDSIFMASSTRTGSPAVT